MKIFNILTCLIAFIFAGNIFALTEIPLPEQPVLESPATLPMDNKDSDNQEAENKELDNKVQNSDEFSGHYLFEGKMFYYDQITGELIPVNDASEKPKSNLAQNEPDEKSELLEELKKEESSFEKNYKKPISLSALASGSQEFGTEELSCKEWGSPIIKNKMFSSKDECEEELQKKKEEALTAIDKYLEEFEKEKTALMIKSNLEEYERISRITLKKDKTIETILRVFKKGCKCRY